MEEVEISDESERSLGVVTQKLAKIIAWAQERESEIKEGKLVEVKGGSLHRFEQTKEGENTSEESKDDSGETEAQTKVGKYLS